MPIKHTISPGVGFSPGLVKWIVTRGLGAMPAPTSTAKNVYRRPTQNESQDTYRRTP